MGITMSAKRTITNAIAARYRAESKRGKQMMLDEFCRTTGYHRKYAIQLLGSWGTQRIHRIDGKPVAFVVGTPRKPHKRTRHRVYDERVHHALHNRAHRWVQEAVVDMQHHLPFPLKGIDSDNGREFINTTLLTYCRANGITFTRGCPYRKNDNCFVEQKNDIAVRQVVGYYRFTTDAEYQALQAVYTRLCPLLNYFYASVKLTKKIQHGPRITKVYEPPKPPYRRLLESPLVADEVKDELRRRAQKLHIVKQKRLVDQAIAHLLRIHQDKSRREHPSPGSSTTTLGTISS